LTNTPKISVVIPVFNREELINSTLESVLLQSFQEWECIIVDDYSTDNTVETLKKWAEKDKRFKFFAKTNEKKGAPSSRNIGWKNANSDLIIFLDSDDLLAPWALEKRMAFMEENVNLDFSLSPPLEFNNNNNNKYNYRALIYKENPLKLFLEFNAAWQTSSPTWKMKALKDIGGWDEDALSWQDGEIHIRALLKKMRYKWMSKIPDVFIRISGNSKISNTFTNEKLKNNYVIFNKILNHIDFKKDLKEIFKTNITIRTFNLIENLSINEKKELIEFLQRNKEFNFINIKKLKFYNFIFEITKNIKGLRGILYKVRIKSSYFPKRKKFFKKDKISSEVLKDVRSRIKNIPLYKEVFI